MVQYVDSTQKARQEIAESSAVNNIEESQGTEVTTDVYDEFPGDGTFMTLQANLRYCLSIVDNEVMKNYVSVLQDCQVEQLSDTVISGLGKVEFFRISQLVYQEDEFSVPKLAAVFHALSGKPCTLVLMIQSDGANNEIYLGIRSRDGRYETGTMRNVLEQSLLGQFPGSCTDFYPNETMIADLQKLSVKAVSSVTCIADYKQEMNSYENKNFIQGLEKLLYSMQGKAFTAVCIANNLERRDLLETRKEYERIYTLMSPFANMQYNYALNTGSATSESDTLGDSETDTTGVSSGKSIIDTHSQALQEGTSEAQTKTDTTGSNVSVGEGQSYMVGTSDGVNDSDTKTRNVGVHFGTGHNVGINAGFLSFGRSKNSGVSASVSRAHTHGTSHTDSVSDTVSRNLTYGLNTSLSIGNSVGKNHSVIDSSATSIGSEQSENQSRSISSNTAHTTALSETFGSSQAVTLNVQNKELIDTLQRLENQLERLDECESIGMWDFAAYFLGEGAAITASAANMYRSLISGNQSGLEVASVNTWTDEKPVSEIAKYVTNFLHPVFHYKCDDPTGERDAYVDATVLASTNELAIQLGLPRQSVKGLPIIEHALFAQEILKNAPKDENGQVRLGVINHLGKNTDTPVDLDIESLSMHTFITGSTGKGKSNAIYSILEEAMRKRIRFLVIEPAKGEYKNRFGRVDGVSVFGTNKKITPLLRINPFSFPDDVHVLEHIDRLIEIFNVCWPMYAAMPAVLKDAVERAYIAAGWDLAESECRFKTQAGRNIYPTFIDVLKMISTVMQESRYSADTKGDYIGALCTRVKSLTNGIYGQVFTVDELPSETLFDTNVIVDLSRVNSTETKSLLMGLLVMKMQEYRSSQATGSNRSLNHLTVLEEAHNLLKRTSTEQSSESANLVGKSVEMLANSIAEMRTYGEGFIIADQAPGLLDPSVIRNTNTKIILGLPDLSDRELVGRAASLNDSQIEELAKLPTGVAAVYQNNWEEPVLCKINRCQTDERSYNKPEQHGEPSSDAVGLNEFLRLLMLPAPEKNKIDPEVLVGYERAVWTLPVAVDVKANLLKYLKETDHGRIRSLRFKTVFGLLRDETEQFLTAADLDDFDAWYLSMLDKLEPLTEGMTPAEKDKVLAIIAHENKKRKPTPQAIELDAAVMKQIAGHESGV